MKNYNVGRPRLLLICLLFVLLTACTGRETPTPIAREGLGSQVQAAESRIENDSEDEVAQAAAETAVPTETPTPLPTAAPITLDTADTTPLSAPASPTPVPTVTNPPTGTPTDTPEATSTASPTPTPTPRTHYTIPLANENGSVRAGAPTPIVPVPTLMPPIPMPDGTINILLMGNDDAESGGGVSRTDSMIIVSVNVQEKTANLLTLPRDLYVYIPGWTMYKINTAAPFGGISTLRQTILYNFGIPIHYHARIDFDVFRDVIDVLGGVNLAVGCRLEDWRLKAPDLDIYQEDNYERFALDPGFHQMDGDTALWYARSRMTTSDLDRGRRQQQLIRAILDKGIDAGLMLKAPELWETYQENIETDMDIGRLLQLAAMAEAVRSNGVQSHYLPSGTWYPMRWETSEGPVTAYIPNGDVMRQTLERLYQLPQLGWSRKTVAVEIINASGRPELTDLTAEMLAWYGFVPIFNTDPPPPAAETSLTFHAANLRGAYPDIITWLTGVGRSGVIGEDDYDITLDPIRGTTPYYTLVLGEAYDPCRPEIYAPKPATGDNENG